MSKKTKRIILFTIILIVLLALLYFAFIPVLTTVLPFVIAYLIARVIDPAVCFLNERLKFPRKLASILMILITVVLLGTVITLISAKLVREIKNLLDARYEIALWFQSTWNSIAEFMETRFGDSFTLFISENVNFTKLSGYAFSYIKPLVQGTVSVAVSVPTIILFIVVTLMSTYFMSSDRKNVSRAIYRSLPKSVRAYALNMNKELSHTLLAYLRAQGIMLCITFFELTLGFSFMGGKISDYALILALVIALIDVLPVFGTGTVLIPWSIYMFFFGSYKTGIALLILYLVCLFVRQILEPKIVSGQIGMHPLLTLFSMYIGARVLGVFGLILGPIIAITIKKTADAGVFRDLWNYVTRE